MRWQSALLRNSRIGKYRKCSQLLSASQMAPEEIAELLRKYVSLRLRKSPPLAFEAAQSLVYNQAFYPLVQHLNFALQPSAAARMDFVREVADSVEQVRASVVDL